MWNKDSARCPPMTLPRNLSPANASSHGPRHFPPPPISNSPYAPPHCPFFQNTFSPVHGVPPIRDSSPSCVPQSSDTGFQNSFSFGKHHGLHQTDGISPLSSLEILHAPYSPRQHMAHQQKPSVPSLEQFPQSSLEQFPKNPLEQFPKKSPEQFPKNSLERFPKNYVEQFPKNSLEQFPKNSLEQFPNSALEQFPKSSLEQLPKNPLEQFPKSSLEQFPNSPLEQFIKNPLEQFPKSSYVKTEVNTEGKFSFQNSTPLQIPFLPARTSFGGIPFISDATIDSSSPCSSHGVSVSSAVKQEDSLDYCYNRHTPSDENRESTPSHSFEKGNSSQDHSGFSQDSHRELGDSVENSSKRQKLSHDLKSESDELHEPELEKLVREGVSVVVNSTENSSKCQQPDQDMDSGPINVEKSELEKHITEISEPIVGLDHLEENKKENVPPSLYTYKCSLCKCTILAKHVLMHILGVKHRLRYLKTIDESEHQRIMKLHASQNELADIVAEVVAELEMKHGRGSVKVVCAPSSDVKNNEESTPEDSFIVRKQHISLLKAICQSCGMNSTHA